MPLLESYININWGGYLDFSPRFIKKCSVRKGKDKIMKQTALGQNKTEIMQRVLKMQYTL